jgi:hypothetical protein
MSTVRLEVVQDIFDIAADPISRVRQLWKQLPLCGSERPRTGSPGRHEEAKIPGHA